MLFRGAEENSGDTKKEGLTWGRTGVLLLTTGTVCVIMRITTIQGDKNVTTYRKLYNVTRAIGTKNLEVKMFGTANA